MNFNALEGLINSIVSSFHCDSCKGKIEKKDVHIKAIEGNAVTLEIPCPKCAHKSYIKSEVVSIDLTQYLSKEQLVDIQKSSNKNKKSITDEQVVELNKKLKSGNLGVQDLLNN